MAASKCDCKDDQGEGSKDCNHGVGAHGQSKGGARQKCKVLPDSKVINNFCSLPEPEPA